MEATPDAADTDAGFGAGFDAGLAVGLDVGFTAAFAFGAAFCAGFDAAFGAAFCAASGAGPGVGFRVGAGVAVEAEPALSDASEDKMAASFESFIAISESVPMSAPVIVPFWPEIPELINMIDNTRADAPAIIMFFTIHSPLLFACEVS